MSGLDLARLRELHDAYKRGDTDGLVLGELLAAIPALLAAAAERERLLGEVVNAADLSRAHEMVIADLERALRNERDNVGTLGLALVDRDESIVELRAEVERLRAERPRIVWYILNAFPRSRIARTIAGDIKMGAPFLVAHEARAVNEAMRRALGGADGE